MCYNILIVKYVIFMKDIFEQGYVFLEGMKVFYVFKVDGLVVGKGVLIFDNVLVVKQEFKVMLVDVKFGDVSLCVVIEQFLSGIECLVFVIIDGDFYKILLEVKDYK